MIGLYFFLPSLELMWGWKKAFAFYTAGGIAAGVTFGLISLVYTSGPVGYSDSIGASGSIFAAMGAVALLNPARQLILLVLPACRSAWRWPCSAAFFLLSTLADRNLSNAAHLGGLAFGFFAPWIAGPWVVEVPAQLGEAPRPAAATSERDEQETIDRILQRFTRRA